VTSLERDAAERLRVDEVIWLTTVSPALQPQSSPVWFHWDGADVLVLSAPDATKLVNIGAHAAVALHLNGGEAGTTVVTIEGTARVAPTLAAARGDAYVDKYRSAIGRLGTDPVTYRRDFSVPIVVRADRVRRFRSL
jgi:PPOX class probable F420-dependent enzyme